MIKINIKDNTNVEKLYNKICEQVENAKRNVMAKVNNEMTRLYWNIGKEISSNILNYEKAEYGKSIIKRLSERLTR